MTLHVASLFTGVGGIDLAFERAGAPARLMCEYDKAARGVLARRFPDVPIHPDVWSRNYWKRAHTMTPKVVG